MRRAFTLLEALSVIGIIAVLTAILMPVYRGVRNEALIGVSKSNLHQIFLDTAMYRTNYDGDGVFGSSYAMGLPPSPAYRQLKSLDQLRPPKAPHPATPQIGMLYWQYYNEPGKDSLKPTWEEYALSAGDHAILYADPFNNDPRYPLDHGLLLTRFLIGINLQGSLIERRARGDWLMRDWWPIPR